MEAKKILDDCIDEMYFMENGVLIPHPDEIVLECGDGYMTRKQMKHIVEQRKADGQSLAAIKELVNRIPDVIMRSDFEIPNPNPKYPDSTLRIKVFKKWGEGAIVVMDALRDNRRLAITAYPYRIMFAYFLLLKKLHASAAGEAPSL